jgi:hypothetical protein
MIFCGMRLPGKGGYSRAKARGGQALRKLNAWSPDLQSDLTDTRERQYAHGQNGDHIKIEDRWNLCPYTQHDTLPNLPTFAQDH